MEGFAGQALSIDWNSLAIPTISILEKILRPLLVYAFLVIALRLAGKRELAQLNNFDFVLLLLLSNSVQNAIIGPDNSVTGGLIGALTLLSTNFLVVRFFYRHPGLETAFEGAPELLVKDGVVNEARLAKELITKIELVEAARRQGIDGLDEVSTAALDPDGALTFVAKSREAEPNRHEELLAKIAELGAELHALREELAGRGELIGRPSSPPSRPSP